MTSLLKTTNIRAMLAVAGTALFNVSAGTAGELFDPKIEAVRTVAALQFQDIFPGKMKMAHAYGDRSTGLHGSFIEFAPDFHTPNHTHSGAYHGVVLEGTVINPFNGDQTPPKMEAGSHWYVPAGVKHTTACVSGTACKFYIYADSAFDIIPVK